MHSDPRDFAKTVVMWTIFPMWENAFHRRKFFLHLGKTDTLASDTLDWIQAEYEENDRLNADFGDQIVPGHGESGDFQTRNGMRFLGIGLRGTHRGWRFRQHRPDLIGADDLDDDERVRNQKLVEKDLEKLTSALYFALDDDGTMGITGNIIHPKGIINRIATEEKYKWIKSIVRHGIETDKNGVEYSIWEARKPLAMLQKQRETLDIVTYERNVGNHPVEVSQLFRKSWFRGVSADEIHCSRRIQYLDPAIGTSDSACPRAHIVLGLDQISGCAVVLDVRINRRPVSEMVDDAYSLHEQHHTHICGMEDVLFQKLLWRDFEDGSKQHGYPLPNRGVKNTINKEMRIESMSGPIQLGQIKFLGLTWRNGEPQFENPHMRELYDQLIMYPDHPYRDGPDALEGAYRLLDPTAETSTGYISVKRRGIRNRSRKGH